MRDPIRREAGHTLDAAWWLVPIAFAAAALAAVAFTEGDPMVDESQALVQPEPAPTAATPVSALPQPQTTEPAYEVTEHVQAF